MFSKATALLFALGLTSIASAQSVTDKIAALKLAGTEVDRQKLLEDGDFVFNFLNSSLGETAGAGGHTVAATPDNFPAIVGHGMAMTVGFLGPCGINTPHTHPRATEFNFAVNGTLSAGMLAENGARFILNDIPPGSATIFPRGVIHFEFNNACDPTIFVAAFNDEDPGVDQVAQRFFGLPPDIVAVALGDIGVEQVAGLEAKIPDNVALGTDDCLQRCGITRPSPASTNQRQPRVSANALPAGFSGPSVPPASAATPASIPSYSPPSISTGGFVSQPGATHLSGAASVINDSTGKTNPLVIALIVILGVCIAGYIFLGVGFYLRRKRTDKSRSFGSKYFRTGSEFAPSGAYESEKVFDASDRHTPYDPVSPNTPQTH